MTFYRYQCRYRRTNDARRVYRHTVTARSADEARQLVAIADPLFGSTVASPKRRGEVLPPDPIDEAKARAMLDEGTAVFGR
jgi:hypothetical protein